MSKYIIVGTYSDEGAVGLVSGDTDRVEAMEALCDSVGARLVQLNCIICKLYYRKFGN